MDISKLSTADKVIGGSALLFLIAMFLPWYGISIDGFGSASNSGWDYFLGGILPLLVVLAMVAQIAVTKFSTTELPALPIPWSQAHVIAGAVVAVLVLLRTIIGSSEGSGIAEFDLDREYGMFVALIAAIGVGVGGYLKFQEGDEATSGGAASAPPTPF